MVCYNIYSLGYLHVFSILITAPAGGAEVVYRFWVGADADGVGFSRVALGRNYLVDNAAMIMLRNLLTGYQGQGIGQPLDGCFASGSMTAIVGANGSGKSTLLKTLAGLLPPVQGSLSFGQAGRPRVGYLPQQVEMDRQFPLTVFDVVAMGCWPTCGLLHRLHRAQQAAIWQALTRVGLEALSHRTISTLSGGQFQSMLFARLLVQEAALILLDEPFSGIDKPTCGLWMTVIEQLHRQGRTIIVVLHDNQLVVKHFPQALWLTPKRPAWGPSAQVLALWLESDRHVKRL